MIDVGEKFFEFMCRRHTAVHDTKNMRADGARSKFK